MKYKLNHLYRTEEDGLVLLLADIGKSVTIVMTISKSNAFIEKRDYRGSDSWDETEDERDINNIRAKKECLRCLFVSFQRELNRL